MHIEQVHFDEVFDVQAVRGDFSFRSRGRAHYGVNLQNRVIPRAGSAYAVAFGKPGDWTTVLGCRDLASSKVKLSQPGWTAVVLQFGDFLFFGPLIVVAGLVLGGSWLGLVAATLFMLAIAYAVVLGLRQNRAVTRALLAAGQDDERDNPGALRSSAVQ